MIVSPQHEQMIIGSPRSKYAFGHSSPLERGTRRRHSFQPERTNTFPSFTHHRLLKRDVPSSRRIHHTSVRLRRLPASGDAVELL